MKKYICMLLIMSILVSFSVVSATAEAVAIEDKGTQIVFYTEFLRESDASYVCNGNSAVEPVKGAVYDEGSNTLTLDNVDSTGKLIAAKGLKRGKTYKVKITVKAEGNKNYKSSKLVKTIEIKVR